MSALGWLREVPDEVRRDAYAVCTDAGSPCAAAAWAPGAAEEVVEAAKRLPGFLWASGPLARGAGPAGFRALLAAGAGEVAGALGEAAGGLEVREHAAADLVLPVGSPQGWWACSDVVSAWVARIEAGGALAVWEAADAELRRPAISAFQRSALRWLQTLLETERPDLPLVRGVLERLREWNEAAPERVVVVERAAAPPTAGRPAAAALLRAQQEMLSVEGEPALLEGRLRSAAAVAGLALRALGAAEDARPLEAALDEAVRLRRPGPLREAIERAMGAGGAEAAPRGPAPAAPDQGPADETAAPAAQAADLGAAKGELKVLKVDPERIDRLMDLVGELVVAKNGLPYLCRRIDQGLAGKQLEREIKERHGVLHRIAEDLQASVMRMRMVPVSFVFRRFQRVVRDVGGRLGKQLRLEIEGDETEADKSVVEDLYEPLVHLLRNSMDHGIEDGPRREAAGKPAAGTIRLKACQRDDRVLIEVSDDGGGIDPERVKAKAVEKGIIGAEEAARLDQGGALQLVFLPGFSTAEKASELSGRGVGMDVVRTMVVRAGGSVSLQSELGVGTRVTLELPLTMTVSQIMVFEAGGAVLGVPFTSIVETVRVGHEAIRRVGENEMLVLRGRLVPVFRAARVLNLGGEERGESAAVLVVRAGSEEFGLCVDEFHEGIDVIVRPMDGVMKGYRLFAGTTLLGDGRVLLVLDLKELVRSLEAA